MSESFAEAIDRAAKAAGLLGTGTDRDYPWGAGENDNYQNVCASCELPFRGHKRALVCLRCHKAATARWEAMSPEEQQRAIERNYAEMQKALRRIFNQTPTPNE